MDTELLKLKIKRYLSQYEYLVNEYDETQYLFTKYKKIFYKECPQQIISNENSNNDENKTETNDANNPNNANDTNNTTNISESTNNSNIDKIISKVYKKLCIKTHPDKSSLYTKQFEEVSNAYNKKDFLKLLLISKELNIDIYNMYNEYSSNIDADIDYTLLFEKSIKDINEKITTIKSTLAWNWALSNEEQKKQLRERFLF
jgi:hypothetical protein